MSRVSSKCIRLVQLLLCDISREKVSTKFKGSKMSSHTIRNSFSAH